MKCATSAGCLVFLLIVTTAVAAQTKTDFSGVWKPVDADRPPKWPEPPPGAPPLPPMPPPVKMGPLTITQSATEIKIVRRYERAGEEQVQSFVHKLDGSESVNKIGSSVYTTTAAWDGAALVLTSSVPMEGQSPWRITDVYRIENGQLVVENTMENFRGTFSGKRIYKKD